MIASRRETPSRRAAGRRRLAALVLALAAGCRPGPAAPVRLQPLVLVTIDTLRADHVGAYGYPRDTTPFLDQLAARGVLFEQVVSASSHTAPSHASLMTSRQPFQHGLLKNGQRLPPDNYTLAQMLSAAGYEAAAFTSVSFLAELGQGFQHVDAAWRTGDLTVDAAIAWLDARKATDKPFFLWVHLYDPHQLKGPREKLLADAALLRLADAAQRGRFLAYLAEHGVPPGFYPDEAAMLRRYDLYDAGIRFADRQVGRLYRHVALADPATRWIVTSDHGEGLGSHAYDEHGKYLYDEQVLVPLVVTGVEGPARRVAEMVRLVDVFPTVASWLGHPSPAAPAPQGFPLFGRPAQPDQPDRLSPRFAFSQRRPWQRTRNLRSWMEGDVFSLRTRNLKYIYSSGGKDELFDLAKDPLELDNRIALDPQAAAKLRQLVARYLESSARQAPAPGDDRDEATEHDAELKALGYL